MTDGGGCPISGSACPGATAPWSPNPFPRCPPSRLPAQATEPEAPSFRAKPLPAYAEAEVPGCQEPGVRLVIGCGWCAGSTP